MSVRSIRSKVALDRGNNCGLRAEDKVVCPGYSFTNAGSGMSFGRLEALMYCSDLQTTCFDCECELENASQS